MTATGWLLLEGGAEFGGGMSEPDLAALEQAGGLDVPVAILPTAAAPDRNDARAGSNAVRWFRSLGASGVEIVAVTDALSAREPALAGRLRQSRLIYLLGGFPRYLEEILHGSPAWQAVLDAYAGGAVLGGSSAGAMVLCQHYFDPEKEQVRQGLNLLPACCILPHHNTFGRSWADQLMQSLPEATLIGIDERTGILGTPSGAWRVHGAGAVTLYRGGQPHAFSKGATFQLDLP